MHIRELQLIGFKSFHEKTTLRFSPGVNAVIGPNGCGKSNVLDALRWVLGEQSFSLLRCDLTEDVIFHGTATAPATNYAEVRLMLAGDEGDGLPAEFEIKRRYFRSGESEYFLDRQPCRLKDIQEVFFSSGTGTKAYSIFDARQMRDIISGNIRKLFEEAATLAKYRDAKDDCRRKLGLTEADLTRLDDIIAERERVVRSLQRQAGKQRAHDKLKAEEKNLRLLELRADYEAVSRDRERARADSGALEQGEAARSAEIQRLDEELKTQRARLRDLQAFREEAAARVRDARQAATDLEGRNLLAQQRSEFISTAAARAEKERAALLESIAGLEAAFNATLERLAAAGADHSAAHDRLESVRAETQTSEARLYELKEYESALKTQAQDLLETRQVMRAKAAKLDAAGENSGEAISRLDAELATVGERLTRIRAELESTGARIGETSGAVAVDKQRRESLRAEILSLRARRAALETESAGFRDERARLEKEIAVLRTAVPADQVDACRRLLGPNLLGNVSGFLQVREGWESAAEAALYSVVDFLVTSAGIGSVRLSELAARRPDLRFGFVQLGQLPAMTADGDAATGPAAPPDAAAIIAPLSQYVEVDPMAPPLLRLLVARTAVVTEDADLDSLAAQHPTWSFVTKTGACRFPDGRLVFGGSERGRLAALRGIENRNGRLAEVDALLRRQVADLDALAGRLVRSEEELGLLVVELGDLDRQQASLEATRSSMVSGVEELGRDQARLAAERRAAEVQRSAVEERRSAATAQLAEIDSRIDAATSALGKTAADVAILEKLVRVNLDRSAASLAELSEAAAAVARLESDSAHMKRTLDENRRRLVELDANLAASAAERSQIEKEIASRNRELAPARGRVAEAEAAAEAIHIADLARAEEELDSNLQELRKQHEAHQGLLLDQRLKLHELDLKLTAITNEARTGYGTDLTSDGDIVVVEPTTAPANDAAVLLDVPARLDSVRLRLEALGDVNPLAAEEYRREKADLARLRSQREDVVRAKANLEATLAEVDRRAREQFVATYSEVRGHFQEIFKQLFLEGEADLVLVDDASPLESEVSIIAKPRGKNPRRLEQLSDGEKALVAVSLLFAFYRVKPAPFCFLDEVDAPLDDANVGRFADYLREISATTQVVIITHNRLTVERADVVFGVTAEQPGISKIISVSLADYRARPAAAVTGDAAPVAS